jgi:hypothetical protein
VGAKEVKKPANLSASGALASSDTKAGNERTAAIQGHKPYRDDRHDRLPGHLRSTYAGDGFGISTAIKRRSIADGRHFTCSERA